MVMVMEPKMKPHTAGIVAAIVSLVGLLGSPEFLSLFPAKYAVMISSTGIILQAITKGVQHGGTELVPKDDSAKA